MARPGRIPDPLIAERDARIVAAAKLGIHPRNIANQEVGCTLTIVQRVLREARDSRQTIPYFPRGPRPKSGEPERVGVEITRRQVEELRAYANTRGQTPSECAALLLSAIIDDDLFEAVIGDLED